MERFWASVDMTGDCWLWMRSTTNAGYGKFWLNGRDVGAHRVAYILHYGDIPPGLLVMHSCDNRLCVNPAHLSLGTYRDNARDSMAKGRFRPPEKKETCKNGHPWGEDSRSHVRKDGYVQRRCRICDREYARRRYQKVGE